MEIITVCLWYLRNNHLITSPSQTGVLNCNNI